MRYPANVAVQQTCLAFLLAGFGEYLVSPSFGRVSNQHILPQEPVAQKDSNRNQKNDSKSAKEPKTADNTAHSATKDIRRRLLLSIEEIVATADRISPPEYRILIKVESALVFWRFDRQRATGLLEGAIGALRKLREEEREDSSEDTPVHATRQRVRFQILRRIAAMKPELLKELSSTNSSPNKREQSVSANWTDEARAMISVASDVMERGACLSFGRTEPLGRLWRLELFPAATFRV